MTLHSSVGAWKRKLNPDYYRVARLKYRFIKDDPTRHAEFRRGKLDTLVVDHGAWEDQLKNDPTITEIANHYTYDHIGLLHSTLYFNCRRFPFDDVRLRLAIAHLVDRQRILREVERGQGTVGTCPTKPIYPEYSPEIPVRNLDVELTRKLLREAGWTDTDGDGLLDKEGRVLEFSFAVPAARTFFRTLTALLQESCQGVGIRVKSDIKDWQRFKDDLNKLNFQLLCLYDSASDPWIDPYETFHSSQAGERGQNRSGWSNPQADKLLEEMRREFDPAKRAELFHRLNRLFDEDLPMLLLIHGKVGVLQNKRIRGTKVRATGLQHFDAWIHPEDAKKEEGPK
jgi:peptide/nickel transport system substrate-binding protein